MKNPARVLRWTEGIYEVNGIKIFLIALIFALSLSCAGAGKAREEPAGVHEQEAAPAEGAESLDSALGNFSLYTGQRLQGDALIAVASITAPDERLGNYINDKLYDLLLNEAGLRMASHQDVERVLAEQNIQAGAFDEDTTAKMGHTLGWRTIIYGAVEPLSDAYHLSLRAVDVETGELKGSKSYLITGNDPVLLSIVNPEINMQQLARREPILVPFDGKKNDFDLSVSTNKTIYYDQEFMFITLLSNADCYFVVYHLDVYNNLQVIYPNPWDKDKNSLTANVERVIPENASFLLHAPYGEERILVYASDEPINIPEEQYRARSISEDYLEELQAVWRAGTRALTVQPRGATWQVIYSILPN